MYVRGWQTPDTDSRVFQDFERLAQVFLAQKCKTFPTVTFFITDLQTHFLQGWNFFYYGLTATFTYVLLPELLNADLPISNMDFLIADLQTYLRPTWTFCYYRLTDLLITYLLITNLLLTTYLLLTQYLESYLL